MVLDALVNEIKTYPAIIGYVSTYKSAPAVFGKAAPDAAVFPYVIIRLSMSSGGVNIIDSGNMYIDFYENGASDVRQIAAALSVLNTLDGKSLSNTAYANIRCFRSSFGAVEESRTDFQHYNLQFEIRATRKAFIQSKL